MSRTRRLRFKKRMRSRKSNVTFQRPFVLNGNVGELPPGTYDIEIDEEELQASDRTGYRQVAIYFYVQKSASTRTFIVTPKELESALARELKAGLSPLESGHSYQLWPSQIDGPR